MSNPTPETTTVNSENDTSTVKFNVGGRLYEVSRALVEKFPSTMLARMASDMWQKDREATLFIGRSGERFEYSLDYMRADKVWLPLNISKEALLDDLDFYRLGLSLLRPHRNLDRSYQNHRKRHSMSFASRKRIHLSCRRFQQI